MVQVSLGFNYILPSMSSIYLFFFVLGGGGFGRMCHSLYLVQNDMNFAGPQSCCLEPQSMGQLLTCGLLAVFLLSYWMGNLSCLEKMRLLMFLEKFLVCWRVSWLMSMSLMLCCFLLLLCSWCDLAWKKVVNALNSEFFF